MAVKSTLAALGFGYSTSTTAPVLNDLLYSAASTPTAGATENTLVGTFSGKTTGSQMIVDDSWKSLFKLDASQTKLLLGPTGSTLTAGTYAVTGTELFSGASNSPKTWAAFVTIVAVAAPVGGLTVEAVGARTAVGVELFKLQPGASISGTNNTHFTVDSQTGSLSVSIAGDQADLNAGPYTLAVSNDNRYTSLTIPVESGDVWDVTNTAQLKAAYNLTPLTTYGKICVRIGSILNPRLATDCSNTITSADTAAGITARQSGMPTFTLTGRAHTGTILNATAGMNAANVLTVDKNTRGSIVGGGYCEITCRSKYGAKFDGVHIFSGTKPPLITNIDFISTLPVMAIVATAVTNVNASGYNILRDGVNNRTGGTGYAATDTWSWTEATSGASISGGITVDANGKIVTAFITSKNAAAESLIGDPIMLSSSGFATMDGVNQYGVGSISTTSGSNGYIYLTHEQFNYGPLNSGNGCFKDPYNFNQLTMSGSFTESFATLPKILIQDCRFGGYSVQSTRPGLWHRSISARFADKVLIEDCDFGGHFNAVATNVASEFCIRRCGFHDNIEDTMDFYQSGAPVGTVTMSAPFTGTVTSTTGANVSTTGNGATANIKIGNIVVTGILTQGSNIIKNVNALALSRISTNASIVSAPATVAANATATMAATVTAGTPTFDNGLTAMVVTPNIYGVNQFRVMIDQCSFYSVVTGNKQRNNHTDLIQCGTNSDFYGYLVVYTRVIAAAPGFVSSQGFYNDDSLRSFGLTIDALNCLVDINTQAGIVAFRNLRSDLRNSIKNCTVVSSTEASGSNGYHGTIQLAGDGMGMDVDSCITNTIFDSVGTAYSGLTIVNAGSGYPVGSKVVLSTAFGHYAVGTLSLDANGKITGISSWDNNKLPTGFGSAGSSVNSFTTTGTLVGAIASSVNDQSYVSTVLNGTLMETMSNTGNNYFAIISPSAPTTLATLRFNGAATIDVNGTKGVNSNGAAIITDGTYRRNDNTDDINVTNCAFYDQKLPASDPNSFESMFNGPFTNGTISTTTKLYNADFTSKALFDASMKTIFAPKAGGKGVGKGFTIITEVGSTPAPTQTVTPTNDYATRYMFAGTRLGVPIALASPDDTQLSRLSNVSSYTPDYDITDLRLPYVNWAQNISGGTTEVDPGNDLIIDFASVQKGTGGPIYPLSLNGSFGPFTIPSGSKIIFDTVANIGVVSAATQLWIRTSDSVKSGQKRPAGWQRHSQNGEGFEYTATPQTAKATTGTVSTTSSNNLGTNNNNIYGPVCILAKGNDGREVVLTLGDSMFQAQNDVGVTASARGAQGYGLRGIDDNSNGTLRLPYAHFAVAGTNPTQDSSRNSGQFMRRGELFDAIKAINNGKDPFTTLFTDHINNSASAGGMTTAVLQGIMNTFWNFQLSMFPGIRIVQMSASCATVNTDTATHAASIYKYFDIEHQTKRSDDVIFPGGARWETDAWMADGSRPQVSAYIDLKPVQMDLAKRVWRPRPFSAKLTTAYTGSGSTWIMDTKPNIGEFLVVEPGVSTISGFLSVSNVTGTGPYTVTAGVDTGKTHPVDAIVVAVPTTDGLHWSSAGHRDGAAVVAAAKATGAFGLKAKGTSVQA